MYLALTGSAAQIHVLTAAAEVRLGEPLRTEFTDLLAEMRKRASERNRIVHAIWAAPAKYPDALVNCQPDNLVRDVAEAYSFSIALGIELDGPSPEFVEHLTVYRQNDFRDIVGRIHAFRVKIEAFSHRVGEAHQQRQALVHAIRQRTQETKDEPPQGGSQTNP